MKNNVTWYLVSVLVVLLIVTIVANYKEHIERIKIHTGIVIVQGEIYSLQTSIRDRVNIHLFIEKFEKAVREENDIRRFFTGHNADQDIAAWKYFMRLPITLSLNSLEGIRDENNRIVGFKGILEGNYNGNALEFENPEITLIKENGTWKFSD